MDSAKLNDWMQVVGIFALVASLIFVGLQMKQAQEIALAGQYQARAQATVDFFTARMESDYVSEDFMKQVGQEVTQRQIRHRQNNMQIVWTIMDNNHFQHQQGFLTEESWLAYENFIRQLYMRCASRGTFESRKDRMRASFVEFVESQDGPCIEG